MTYPDHAPTRPNFAVRFVLGMALIPAGVMLRVLTQIYLEITQTAVHYWTVMGIVTIGHLILICLTIVAALRYRRKPLAMLTAIQLWIGYGIGAALLALKDMG